MQFKMSTTATTQQQKPFLCHHANQKLNKLSRRQLALREPPNHQPTDRQKNHHTRANKKTKKKCLEFELKTRRRTQKIYNECRSNAKNNKIKNLKYKTIKTNNKKNIYLNEIQVKTANASQMLRSWGNEKKKRFITNAKI